MNIESFIKYLLSQGWTEAKLPNHYSKDNIVGLVAIQQPNIYIIERYGVAPWSRITSIEQFEQDLAHLQPAH